MGRMVARRILAGLGVIVAVLTLTFALLHAAPGDPVQLLLGPSATPEQVATAREALGLNQALPIQYLNWLGDFATGNWGVSLSQGRPVRQVIGEAVPYSLGLAGISLLFSYLIGVAAGALQAARAGSKTDTWMSAASVVAFALPSYWLGLVLVMVFTYLTALLPAFGAKGLDADLLSGWPALADRLRHAVLPVVTLTLVGAGGAARYIRASMLEVKHQPFVQAVAAKGVGPRRLWLQHVFRNALIPVITLLGLSLPVLFSGAVFVESVFAWPGVGRAIVLAVQARDYPVVMAATAIFATLVVIGNLLADALHLWADPRLRRTPA
jgi:peptide/nickel transport system permease protein